MEDAKKIIEATKDQFIAVRELPDGSVTGLLDLMFTRAICLGMTMTGYEKRFCFEDILLANKRFKELQSEDDEPVGYVARRPQIRIT